MTLGTAARLPRDLGLLTDEAPTREAAARRVLDPVVEEAIKRLIAAALLHRTRAMNRSPRSWAGCS